jgi:hypothetical protein
LEGAAGSADESERKRWEAWAGERRSEHRSAVAALFARAELQSPPPREILTAIRTELNAWRYIERMIEQLHDVS